MRSRSRALNRGFRPARPACFRPGTAFFFQLLCPATDRLAMHTDLSSNLRLTDALFQ